MRIIPDIARCWVKTSVALVGKVELLHNTAEQGVILYRRELPGVED